MGTNQKSENYTMKQLGAYAREDMSALPRFGLAILGDCATQHIAAAVRGIGYTKGINIEVWDADYNQLTAQIDDPFSELYSGDFDAVLLFMCTQKLYSDFLSCDDGEREHFADTVADRVRAYHRAVFARSGMHILQTLFPEYDDRVFGGYGACLHGSFIYQLRKLNLLIADICAENGRAFPVDLGFLQSVRGGENLFDSRMYAMAKLPYSTAAIPEVAELIAEVISALRGSVKKCVVLDLDNTLWGGVIGEDGLENIEIGELGTGHALTEFQRWLRELKNRGILLAVCSKNDIEKAREPFLRHPDMILREEDFVMFVANWEDKAANIRRIQETLNISMDSIVFIDDTPFERRLVASLLPEVTVPEMPEDPAEYVDFLRREGLFETVSYSAGDKARTQQYRTEAKRTELLQGAQSYDEYLEKLGMIGEAEPFSPFWYPRIAQLTQRSNQFNLRTVRYTEGDIRRIAEDEGYLTLYFVLRDSFGDHGLISAVILKKENSGKALFIDTWLMSCRVLRRGVEEFIMNSIMALARRTGAERVIGEYLRTEKNAMVSEIYPKMGFAPLGEGRYEMRTDSYIPLKTYIKPAKTAEI